MLEFFPGVVIEGSRQVGKSTLANEGSAPDALITTLDDTAMRDAAATDPAGFISQAGDRQMVIDDDPTASGAHPDGEGLHRPGP